MSLYKPNSSVPYLIVFLFAAIALRWVIQPRLGLNIMEDDLFQILTSIKAAVTSSETIYEAFIALIDRRNDFWNGAFFNPVAAVFMAHTEYPLEAMLNFQFLLHLATTALIYKVFQHIYCHRAMAFVAALLFMVMYPIFGAYQWPLSLQHQPIVFSFFAIVLVLFQIQKNGKVAVWQSVVLLLITLMNSTVTVSSLAVSMLLIIFMLQNLDLLRRSLSLKVLIPTLIGASLAFPFMHITYDGGGDTASALWKALGVGLGSDNTFKDFVAQNQLNFYLFYFVLWSVIAFLFIELSQRVRALQLLAKKCIDSIPALFVFIVITYGAFVHGQILGHTLNPFSEIFLSSVVTSYRWDYIEFDYWPIWTGLFLFLAYLFYNYMYKQFSDSQKKIMALIFPLFFFHIFYLWSIRNSYGYHMLIASRYNIYGAWFALLVFTPTIFMFKRLLFNFLWFFVSALKLRFLSAALMNLSKSVEAFSARRQLTIIIVVFVLVFVNLTSIQARNFKGLKAQLSWAQNEVEWVYDLAHLIRRTEWPVCLEGLNPHILDPHWRAPGRLGFYNERVGVLESPKLLLELYLGRRSQKVSFKENCKPESLSLRLDAGVLYQDRRPVNLYLRSVKPLFQDIQIDNLSDKAVTIKKLLDKKPPVLNIYFPHFSSAGFYCQLKRDNDRENKFKDQNYYSNIYGTLADVAEHSFGWRHAEAVQYVKAMNRQFNQNNLYQLRSYALLLVLNSIVDDQSVGLELLQQLSSLLPQADYSDTSWVGKFIVDSDLAAQVDGHLATVHSNYNSGRCGFSQKLSFLVNSFMENKYVQAQ